MYKTGCYILYKEHMNFRQEPNANSKVIGVIPMGTCIDIIEVADNWGRTRIKDKDGWCCISECFAKRVCHCENDECCYYKRFLQLEKEYNDMLQKIDKIGDILK